MSLIKCFLLLCLTAVALAGEKPDVVIIMADDVGYGDLSCHGNEAVKTPHLDKLKAQSLSFERFYVSPTCSPTRAALMTGRWPFEVGVNHTIAGRSILKPGVKTMADVFREAGYRTGIFGKWHLGDNAPSRPQDRGFDEVFIHKGGGIGQTPDFWGNNYQNPRIYHNGSWVETEGFCTGVFLSQAARWMKGGGKPSFTYIPMNVAHTPWTLPEGAVEKKELEAFYHLIEDMDARIGDFLAGLDRTKTLVIFMSDNGTAGSGYNADMRGRKGSPHEGGVRVPFFISYPGFVTQGREVTGITGHIDVLPSLVHLLKLGTTPPGLDGLVWGDTLWKDVPLQERRWFTNVGRWSGRDDPAFGRTRRFAVRDEAHRLVETGLFDMIADPGQEQNVMEARTESALALATAYQEWWKTQRDQIFLPVRLHIGRDDEKVARLTAHDWWPSPLAPDSLGATKVWDQSQLRTFLGALKEARKRPDHGLPELRGEWRVDARRDGRYRFTAYHIPPEGHQGADADLAMIEKAALRLVIGNNQVTARMKAPARSVAVELDLKAGPHEIEAWWEGLFLQDPPRTVGCFFLDIERIGEMAQRRD